jgi:hypothetical protein
MISLIVEDTITPYRTDYHLLQLFVFIIYYFVGIVALCTLKDGP